MSNLTTISLFTLFGIILIVGIACTNKKSNNFADQKENNLSAKDILGDPKYPAISYGGYRQKSRDIQPTLEELREDMKLLYAMGIRIIRTYNVQLPHASNVLKAIASLKAENPDFEMYVMLGAWIDCKNAWTDQPVDHNVESELNAAEIDRAVALANRYPDIVKVLAVGNEAMVKWATAYFVQADVILKWVTHLQNLKKEDKLSNDLLITSSDNFASWGGGDSEYHTPDLEALIQAVDYISIHTYPMHDTHYNPVFWGVKGEESELDQKVQIKKAMVRAKEYAQSQFDSVKNYMQSLGVDKPIHIGETGWASFSNEMYGDDGTKATDEYKQALYYQHMVDWAEEAGISCFFFEAFDEPWKDAGNEGGSENHFGLITVDGKAKFALWSMVDKGVFEGLSRGGNAITKTYDGNADALMEVVKQPPVKNELSLINYDQ